MNVMPAWTDVFDDRPSERYRATRVRPVREIAHFCVYVQVPEASRKGTESRGR